MPSGVGSGCNLSICMFDIVFQTCQQSRNLNGMSLSEVVFLELCGQFNVYCNAGQAINANVIIKVRSYDLF